MCEWLAAQAASGYVTYDSPFGRFTLPEEQAFALANDNSPAFLPGAFQLATAAIRIAPKLLEAFRTGVGVGWHEHDPEFRSLDGAQQNPGHRFPDCIRATALITREDMQDKIDSTCPIFAGFQHL